MLFVSVVEYAVTAGPVRLARARARGGTLTTQSVTLATSSVTKVSPVLCAAELTGPPPTGRWFSATSAKGNGLSCSYSTFSPTETVFVPSVHLTLIVITNANNVHSCYRYRL